MLSCNTDKTKPASKRTGIHSNIITIKDDESGFVSLINAYDQKSKLILYNSDQSIWQSFIFNDNFNDNSIDPYAIKPENGLLVFTCLGKKNGYYKICVDENKKIIKYIKISDSHFKYQSVADHILTVFSVDFNEVLNPLRLKPDAGSGSFPKDDHSFYYPIKVKGNWLEVTDDNKRKFWIKWCDEKRNLIVDLYYDA